MKMSEEKRFLFTQRLGAPLPLLARNTHTLMYHYLSLSYVYTHILTLQQTGGLFSSMMQKKKDFGQHEIKEVRLQIVHALQSMPFVLVQLLF